MERHNEISEFIWGIKEHIRDEYAEKDYEDRKNKVQLINAIHPRFTKKIKSPGKKQYEISDDGISLITDIYKTYKDYSISHLLSWTHLVMNRFATHCVAN